MSNFIDNIVEQEFEQELLKFCSFVSMIHNKSLKYTTIFILLVREQKLRDILKQMTQVENDYQLLLRVLKIDDKICRSVLVKRELEKFNAKRAKVS